MTGREGNLRLNVNQFFMGDTSTKVFSPAQGFIEEKNFSYIMFSCFPLPEEQRSGLPFWILKNGNQLFILSLASIDQDELKSWDVEHFYKQTSQREEEEDKNKKAVFVDLKRLSANLPEKRKLTDENPEILKTAPDF